MQRASRVCFHEGSSRRRSEATSKQGEDSRWADAEAIMGEAASLFFSELMDPEHVRIWLEDLQT
ncbi:MAG: hypothetical protein WC817_03945 [Patescibacteria group bacterium]